MTEQEKYIIETILVDVGLEPLYAGVNDQESNPKPVKNNVSVRSEFSRS